MTLLRKCRTYRIVVGKWLGIIIVMLAITHMVSAQAYHPSIDINITEGITPVAINGEPIIYYELQLTNFNQKPPLPVSQH